MAATIPAIFSSVIQDAMCLACYAPGDMGEMVEMALLQLIAKELNPMAVTDPRQLLATSECFSCYGMSQTQLIRIGLLLQLLQSISGGVSCMSADVGPPTFTPTLPCTLYHYTDTTDGTLYTWYDNAWHPPVP